MSAARELGFNCLLYLRDNFIQRRVQVAKDVVLPLQRVIAKASAYFNLEPEEMGPDQEFAQLSNSKSSLLYSPADDEADLGTNRHSPCRCS